MSNVVELIETTGWEDTALGAVSRSFRRHLRATRSERTIETYCEALDQFLAFVALRRFPMDPTELKRLHLEEFFAHLRERGLKPSTVNNRYRSLSTFFKWLMDEEEITSSPLAKIPAPKIELDPPDVLSEDDLKKLLAACSGKDFESRRDLALLAVFIDTGCRRSEVVKLRYLPSDPLQNDVDLDAGRLRVFGKGRGGGPRERLVRIGPSTIRDLDRYLRLRSSHKFAHLPDLWLGLRGALQPHSVEQMLWRRARQAGLPHVHLHQFRHGFAHHWLSDGGNEGDLMQLAGWNSRSMLTRYAAKTARDRALAAAASHSLRDRLRDGR